MSFCAPKFTSTPKNSPDDFLRTVNDVADVIKSCIGTGNSILQSCYDDKSDVFEKSPLLQKIIANINADTESIAGLSEKLVNLGSALATGNREELKQHFESTIENIQKISETKLLKLADIDCAAKAQSVRKNFENTGRKLQEINPELDEKARKFAACLIDRNQKVVNCLKYAEKRLINLFETYGQQRAPQASPRTPTQSQLPKGYKKLFIFGESLMQSLPSPIYSELYGSISIEESGPSFHSSDFDSGHTSSEFRKVLRGYLEDSEGNLEEVLLEAEELFKTDDENDASKIFQSDLSAFIEIGGQVLDRSVPVIEIDKKEAMVTTVMASVENEVTGNVEEVEVEIIPTSHDEGVYGKILSLHKSHKIGYNSIHKSFDDHSYEKSARAACLMPSPRKLGTAPAQSPELRNFTPRTKLPREDFQTPTLQKQSHQKKFQKAMNFFRASEALRAGIGQAALRKFLQEEDLAGEGDSGYPQVLQDFTPGESPENQLRESPSQNPLFRKMAHGVMASNALQKGQRRAGVPVPRRLTMSDSVDLDDPKPSRPSGIPPKRFQALLNVYKAVDTFNSAKQRQAVQRKLLTGPLSTTPRKKNDLRNRLGRRTKTGSRMSITEVRGKATRPEAARKRNLTFGDFPMNPFDGVESIEDIELSLVGSSSSDDTMTDGPEEAIRELHDEVQKTAEQEMRTVLPSDQRAPTSHQARKRNPFMLSQPFNGNVNIDPEKLKEFYRMHVRRPQSAKDKTAAFDKYNDYFESRKVPAIVVNDEALETDSRMDVGDSASDFSATSMPLDDLDAGIAHTATSTPKRTPAPPADSHLLHPEWDQSCSIPPNYDSGSEMSELFGGMLIGEESFNNREIMQELYKKMNNYLDNLENPLGAYSPARDMTDFAELQEQRRRDMTEARFKQVQDIGSPGFDVTLDGGQDWQLDPMQALNDYLDNPYESSMAAYSPPRNVTDFATLQERRNEEIHNQIKIQFKHAALDDSSCQDPSWKGLSDLKDENTIYLD